MLLALELDQLPAVVFGTTEEAARRARDLSRAGARVTVVTPVQSDALSALESEGLPIAFRVSEPSPADLDGQWLAVVADRNAEWAKTLGLAARERRVFFCAVDQPGQNTFAHVGIARSGDLTIGVSTGGRAPGLVAVLTRELARLFQRSRFEEVVSHVAELRQTAAPEERAARVRSFVQHIRIDGTILTPLTPGDPLASATQTEEP